MGLPTSPTDPRNVRVTAAGSIDTYWTLDDNAAPELTKGFGGWTSETRARRRALLFWGGPPEWTQTVPVILNCFEEASLARAVAANRRSRGLDAGQVTSDAEALVARQWAAIKTLHSLPAASTPPPTCTLTGVALEREGGNWVLLDRQRAEAPLRNVDDGALLRWRGVLTFGQIVQRDVLEISGLSTPKGRLYQTYRWKTGDTLQRVAAKLLGKASRWQEITFLDGTKPRGSHDPKLKAGVVVRAPAT